MRTLARFTLTICVPLFAGCGGSQQQIGAPVGIPQGNGITPSSSSYYQVLYSFAGRPDGAGPLADLIDVNGTLYGTTELGGSKDRGTVFTITTDGAEKVLYSFRRPPDGDFPGPGLADVGSTLYGTTNQGGSHDRYGTIFSLTPSGTEKVLYSFGGKPDGRHPNGGMIDVGGTLYGTTTQGGDSNKRASGEGTVFSVTINGTEKKLHNFGHGTDGRLPHGPLIDVGGTFYGTTAGGGAYGDGTAFTITTDGAEKVLYSFRGPPDGAEPMGGLVNVGGTVYGVTYNGGTYDNRGTVYSISTSGTEKVLHSFGSGSDGKAPLGSLIDVKGTLYGTTAYGGAGTCGSTGCGTVFSISTSGTEKVVHSFGPSPYGLNPDGTLIDVNGTLYGVTYYGGTHQQGTFFALTP